MPFSGTTQLRDQQYDVLLQYKRQEKEAQGKKFDGVLNSWEGSFYAQQARGTCARARLCAPPAFPAPSSLDFGTARVGGGGTPPGPCDVCSRRPNSWSLPWIFSALRLRSATSVWTSRRCNSTSRSRCGSDLMAQCTPSCAPSCRDNWACISIHVSRELALPCPLSHIELINLGLSPAMLC
jgi:hypothetical protein